MAKSRIATALLAVSLTALAGCAMNGYSGGSQASSAAPSMSPQISPDLVKQIQTTLKQQNDYDGAIDGLWGPATQTALQTYQKAHGLTANGQIDPPTAASLRQQRMSDAAAASLPPAAAPAPAPDAPAVPAQ